MSGNYEALAKLGFKLFPVTPGEKGPPLFKGWPEKATADLWQLNQWAELYPGCNWGIHCEDMVVVDIDAHKGGLESAKAIKGLLPSTLTVKTPSGGYHMYYRHEGGVANSVSKALGQAIDIRTNGGYVVAPGCTAGGGRYYKINGDWSVTPAPAALIERCFRAPASIQLPPAPENIDQDRAAARARDWLARQSLPEQGERDARLMAASSMLKDFGVAAEQAEEVLQIWLDCMDLTDFPPEQIRKCIAQGYKTENPAGCRSDEAVINMLPKIEPAVVEAPAPEPAMIYGLFDVDLEAMRQCDYLVKNWIGRAKDIILHGPYSSGKTFFALRMCAHIAAGRDWWGERVKQGGVLYLNYEGHATMGKRLVALTNQMPELACDPKLPLFVTNMRKPLVTREKEPGAGQPVMSSAMDAFNDRAGSYPDLIVIDTMRNALGGGESDTDLTQAYAEMVHELVDGGISVMTIHHPGHADKSRSRGDSGIEAGADTVIKLSLQEKTATTTKQRDGLLKDVGYDLRVVNLGVDIDGDPMTSCIAVEAELNVSEAEDEEPF